MVLKLIFRRLHKKKLKLHISYDEKSKIYLKDPEWSELFRDEIEAKKIAIEYAKMKPAATVEEAIQRETSIINALSEDNKRALGMENPVMGSEVKRVQ